MWKRLKKMAKEETLTLSAVLVGVTLLLTAINLALIVMEIKGRL